MQGESYMEEITFIYERYGAMVLRRYQNILQKESKAEETMQDVFMQVIKNKDSLNLSQPSSLLWKMATNICLNRLKKSKREVLIEKNEIFEELLQDDHFEERAISKLWLQFFGKKENDLLLVACLHYVDNMTLEEVSKITNLSVSGVRKRLTSLKEKARKGD